MKFANLAINNQNTLAVVDTEQNLYWPVESLLPTLDSQTSSTDPMVSLISQQPNLSQLKDQLKPSEGKDLGEARYLAPITQPPHNILCVGKNYLAHAHEFSGSGFDSSSTNATDAIPEFPIIFTKASTVISGPGDDVPLWPGLEENIDYEVELAVIIGKPCRMVSKAQALDYVFGYTIFNDVTERELQKKHKQWFLGKSIDGFGPMGPYIATRDEVDLQQGRIECLINGEVRQDSVLGDMIFDVPTLIETISRSVTLMPGDIIATGTPVGVGIGFKPPRYLKDGDAMECRIAGLGSLKNTVRKVNG